MKVSAIYLAAIAQVASAHYFFDNNIVGGKLQRQFQYVRQSTRQTKYNPIKFSSNPAADIRDGSFVDGPDIVCNQGAFSSASKTEVLTVAAGEEVRLKVAVGAKMGHPGPEMVYMAAAPDGVKNFSGIGADWFKIHEKGVCEGGDFTSTAWCDYNADYIAAVIPVDTPPMEYLMRFEHIGVHRSHVNQPEHYVGCIQVKVTGNGKGVPGPTVKFPGAYKSTDPYANFSIYNGRKDFIMPGPKVWKGGAGKQETTPAQPASSGAAAVSSAAPVASPSKAPVSAVPSKAPVSAIPSAAPSKAPVSAPAARPSTLATMVKPKPTGGCGYQKKRRSH